jgi:hypothetical protein
MTKGGYMQGADFSSPAFSFLDGLLIGSVKPALEGPAFLFRGGALGAVVGALEQEKGSGEFTGDDICSLFVSRL